MFRILSCCLLAVLFGCGGSMVTAQTIVGGGGSSVWVGGSPVQTQIVLGSDGTSYVGVWVDAPDLPAVAERAPMSLALVIDTSGSMSGEKIVHAKIAAVSMVERAQDGDIVSLYGFANNVVQYAAPTVINRSTRSALIRTIDQQVHAGGGTNMYGGLQAGIQGLSGTPSSHAIRRLMLISDGHANVGPSDPYSLSNLAVQGTEVGAQVSAIGVGVGYSESLLSTIAVRTAGRLYHLSQPHQMASILERELVLLGQTVATNAFIEVIPASGVTIIEGLSMGTQMQGQRLRIPLGALYSGQRRQVLFRARLATAQAGQSPLGTLRLVYDADEAGRPAVEQNVALTYQVTRNAAQAQSSRVPRVAGMVADYEGTQQQLAAVAMLNRGESQAAARTLSGGAARMRAAADAAPPDSEERSSLRQRARALDTMAGRARSAPSPAAAREQALENNDMAMEAEGF